MKSRQRYDVTARSKAPASVIWALMLDAASWPVWSCVDSLERERSAGLDPEGRDRVGAVRAFRTGRMVTGERLTMVEPEKRLAYEDAFNPVMRDYQATIELEPAPDAGTSIHWYGAYSTRWGMGWYLGPYLQRYMRKMADGLAAHAEMIRR
ncbi:SRPBCC family protein [Catenulispora pinistramenti]|uniref:SRPBCC family protein n=1 Tax=Catenulispora pinistramenti TaxID=2705254 RepID=UPI0022A747FB